MQLNYRNTQRYNDELYSKKIKSLLLDGTNVNQIAKKLKINFSRVKRLKLQLDAKGYNPSVEQEASKLKELRQQFRCNLLDVINNHPYHAYTLSGLADIISAPSDLVYELLLELADENYIYEVPGCKYTAHEDAMDYFECNLKQGDEDDMD